jgi:hypothetical protein
MAERLAAVYEGSGLSRRFARDNIAMLLIETVFLIAS